MSTRNRGATAFAIVAFAVSMLCPPTSQAEVGVHLQSNTHSELKVPYIMTAILEDPDPFGGVWSEFSGHPDRVTLNPEGFLNGDGPPSMVYNPVSDLVIVAWARNSASGFDVVVSWLSEDAWSPPQVLADSLDDELDPKLLVDPSDGAVHVVYWIDETTPRVMHRQAPPDLSSWTPPEQVSDPGESACRPDGVVDGGLLRVAYEAHNSGLGQPPLEIVMATRNGSTFSTETVEISHFSGKNWPEIHGAAGRLWIDWVDAEDAVAWVCLEEQGQWGPVEHVSYASSEELLFRVRGEIRLQVILGN